jgi:hypothetical protein
MEHFASIFSKKFNNILIAEKINATELANKDCCDIIIITGDAYVDHPSFGMAIIGRI